MLELNAEVLLQRVSDRIPVVLRDNAVVIGSIATAWAFRDISHTSTVATKDIDLLLCPSVDAVLTAEAIGEKLLEAGWQPQFPHERRPGTRDTPDNELPALRLTPPDAPDGWFVELLAEAAANQQTRKHWRRIHTSVGQFGLPSFRFMAVAVHDAMETGCGLKIANPACMALAHMLEHEIPDRTPISGLPSNPPRFVKDLGRAVALCWLAHEQSPNATREWREQWHSTLRATYSDDPANHIRSASAALKGLQGYLREAHALAIRSVLAPHGTTLDSFERAYTRLAQMLAEPLAKAGRREEKAAQAADDDEKPVDGDESPPSGFRPPGG